jgi:hypothetical protein
MATQRAVSLKNIKAPREGTHPQNHRTPSTFLSHKPYSSLRLCLQPFSTMFPIGIPQYDLEDLNFSGKNIGGDSGFDDFNYLEPSNVAGQSQTYSGVEVTGDFNNYLEYLPSSTASVPVDQRNKSYPNPGESCRTFQHLSFKSSLFNLRIHLPILPECTRAPLVQTSRPSLPSFFLLIPGPLAQL